MQYGTRVVSRGLSPKGFRLKYQAPMAACERIEPQRTQSAQSKKIKPRCPLCALWLKLSALRYRMSVADATVGQAASHTPKPADRVLHDRRVCCVGTTQAMVPVTGIEPVT